MIKRPKPGEDEEDILKMQEEYLREKAKNQGHHPAAQVVNLRGTAPTKRASPSSSSETRKPSKYAQAKGLKNHSEKRPRNEREPATIGDIVERNLNDIPEANEKEAEDDKVYFPQVLPSVLGNIVEKNVSEFKHFDRPMPSTGFPVVSKRNPELLPGNKIKSEENKQTVTASKMDVDEPSTSQTKEPMNLPSKSFILTSKDASEIHQENVEKLNKMSEAEILKEKERLLSSLDPKLIEFLKSKRNPGAAESTIIPPTQVNNVVDKMDMDTTYEPKFQRNSLWENDVLSHPEVDKWLHFDSLEKDKLEWMKGIKESKKIKPDEPYEARFDFKGYLLPYSMEYNEKTKTLFHHGDEAHRPGYTLTELIELSRSAVTQQRVMALNTLAGVLEYYSAGTYKDILELPLSKIFFIIRFAIDENKTIILEPALKAMRNLIFNRVDEASLDALLGLEEGSQQPSLENDKSEIEELESKEDELKDFHLAEIDIIAILLRTDILQRLYYILETVKPSFNSVQYCLQILTRIARDSVETATIMVQTEHLMKTIIEYFVPITSINFAFDPQIVYKGKPMLSALKLLRVLSLQSKELSETLVTKYAVLKPISEYITSGVDGTYGLRIQIEAFSILSNLLSLGCGADAAISLKPIIVTTLYKHVQGTDVFINSSVLSATHAAVVLQLVHSLLTYQFVQLDDYKHQIYPLIKEGVQKWLTQLTYSEKYTCGHLRLVCAALDCCKIIIMTENVPLKFLNDSLKVLSTSRGYREITKNLPKSSNLLSGIENKDLHLTKNLMSLGGSVIVRTQNVLPILNVVSPIPFLASLFQLLVLVNDNTVSENFVVSILPYMRLIDTKIPSLSDNWFSRIESDFLLYTLRLAIQNEVSEENKDLLYKVANKLCYILRADKKRELEFLFNTVVFNKHWFTAERLFNLVSLSDTEEFSKALTSIEDIRICYSKVINLNFTNTGPNVVLKKWQEPILPRDWIYLPILTLYSRSQEVESTPRIVGEHANKIAQIKAKEKELVIRSSLEWILFNELCFPDLLQDIDPTDRLCRIMCVFLCDNDLFLDATINFLMKNCLQIIFKKNVGFNFDKQLTGLHNFQDFYTQLLEQFQSVSYGDHNFASCVLTPLAQKHNVKWRKLLWSEYAGCLRALDCPQELLCYKIDDYLLPIETDESLIKSYIQALSSNLLRPETIAHQIASHHVREFRKTKTNPD